MSADTQSGSDTVSGGTSLSSDDDKDKSYDKGSFDSPEGSLDYHFNKHGKEVGAENIEQYLRKATEFAKNLRGARTVKLNNPTPGVIRYYKNGKYLDKLGDKIISFGKQ